MRVAVPVILVLLIGCARIGEPSRDEREQLEAWSKLVTPKDREEVTRAADAHTDWMEKRKVQYMIGQYRARYLRARERQAATRPAATKPASGNPFGP